jgi:uncharacterized peroxidase-related enzyme
MYDLIDPQTAVGPARALLEATREQLGRVPNLYRAMANSPKALAGYLAFRGALQAGGLEREMCERIALLVAEINGCDYCVAAHSFRAQKIGMSLSDIADSRRAASESPKVRAALAFVKELLEARGLVAPETRLVLLQHGWSEGDVGEIVAHVALNVFSNYFKQISEPALDFPPVPTLT